MHHENNFSSIILITKPKISTMKTKIFTLIFALALASLLDVQAQSEPDGPQLGRGREYVAGYIGDETVTVDASAGEPFWILLPFARIDTTVAGTAHDPDIPLKKEDFEGKFKLAWDDDNLYIYITAVDDSIVTGSGTGADNIEIFFNTDGLWYTREANDHATQQFRDPYRDTKNFTASQIRVNVGNDIDVTGGGYALLSGDDSNYDFKSVITAKGFAMEIKVPFEYIINPEALSTFTPEEGAELFFDIGYGDVDEADVGSREHIIHWNATNPDAWKDVRLFGKVTLGPKLELPEECEETGNELVYNVAHLGSRTVDIDPTVVEEFWDWVDAAPIATVVAGSAHDEGIALTSDDFSGEFKVVWDDNNLYLLVNAVDDNIVTGSGTAADNIELFFNTDALWCTRAANDHETQQFRDPYRDAKNFTASQIRVNVGNDNDVTGGGYALLSGDDSEYDFKSVTTDDGFVMKVKIPFVYITNPDAQNTFLPELGGVLKFDIGYGDVDDEAAGSREHIVHWNADSPDGWKDVRLFGTLVLSDEVEPNFVASPGKVFNAISVYPVPAISNLTVEHNDFENCRSISIVNILGQVIMSTTSVERVNVFSIDRMPAGIYMVYAVSNQGIITTKKFVKKQ
jgi:hypothetical protein